MNLREDCPHCGSLEWEELVSGEINGITAEADYFCKNCRRHLGFFAYGSWQPGSGQVMTAAEAAKIAALAAFTTRMKNEASTQSKAR